jgi:hypothetical protein
LVYSVDLGQQTGLSYQWNTALAAGTAVVFFIEDKLGNEAWSGTVSEMSSFVK